MDQMIKIESGFSQPSEHIGYVLKWAVGAAAIIVFACYPAAVMAVEMPELAKKNECVNCHAIDERIVGPAWMDVSKKYQNDPAAEEKLLSRISKGSSGFFGLIHMPANDPDGHKQAEMKELVKFVLGLVKGGSPTPTKK
ncbi:MAG: c-type cytochrome [Gallionella sp.]